MTQTSQSADLFRQLVESARDYAIFMLDPSGRVATWNLGAERIKGYTATEIIGTHFSAFYPPEDVAAGKCELELEIATRDGSVEDEGWRVRKNGTQFWANVVLTAVRAPDGTLVGFSKVTRDLTERRRSEEERAARLAAEQANRAKDEFLAILGHELRNPLAPIVTALELIELQDGALGKQHAIIRRQVQHMQHLVDDLLDVSRIAQGKIELRTKVVDLRTILALALERTSPLLETRGHRIAVELGAQPVLVAGDEDRLTQVFTNLIANAAKYTPAGGQIWIELVASGSLARVDIRDDGVGIEATLLPRVFELFVQGLQDSSRAAGGLGLGLAVVKSLVALHGGSVAVRSGGPDTGSTFSVTLPLADALAEQVVADIVPVPDLAADRTRIVLVDDNEDARELLGEWLEAAGFDVRSAADAASALALIREFRPSIAILDIGLPVTDGYELAVQVRAEHPDRPRLIALTGYARANDRERSASAGFELHLAKPIDPRSLVGILRTMAATVTQP